MAESNDPTVGRRNHAARVGIRIAITSAMLLAFGAHLIWPHLLIDHIAVALLAIATVPWLGSVLKSVEITGLGKAEFLQQIQELNAKVDDVTEQAKAATQSSSFASGATATSLELGEPRQYSPEAILRFLGQHYVHVREAMPRGWKRTAEVPKFSGE